MWNKTLLIGRKGREKNVPWYLEAVECDTMLHHCKTPFMITNPKNKLHSSVAHNTAFWTENGELYMMGGKRNPQNVARNRQHIEDNVYYSKIASLDSLKSKHYKFQYLWRQIENCTEKYINNNS